jgi:general secretion pathway protein D
MLPLKIAVLMIISTTISAEEVTLNFRDTDIKDFINVISEITKKTFVVDPRVRGKVTVVSNQEMDSKQVYEVFLSILSVHGFAAIPSGAIVKIIPDNLAKSQNTPVSDKDDDSISGEIPITQVIQLKHISAPQLIPLLRPLIRQQGHLMAYKDNNSLVISDHANNVRRLRKIITRLDKPKKVDDDSDDVEVIILEHAIAAEVVRTLTALDNKKKPPIAADDRTNSVLITGDSATRLRLRTLVIHLDTPIKEQPKTNLHTQVIYLHYAQAKDLVEVLKGISDSLIKKDSEIKTNIQADEYTNSLIITAPSEIQLNLHSVIRKLDVRRAQVLVEAVIAEVSNDIAHKLGVQWVLYGNQGTAPVGMTNFDNSGVGIANLANIAQQVKQNQAISNNIPAGAFLGLGKFDNGIINFGVLLQALSSDTNTNVLSTPSLLTLDNQEAEIVVGQNVPFVTGQFTNTGAVTGATNPFQTIQREDIGIKLKVKPQINEGNSIKLEIEQEVSSIIPTSSAATDLVTNKRTIKTTVIVEDGSMVILGGLMDEDLQQTEQKVPGLGDLPVIGSLFRSQQMKKVKRNLMVFLHPIIVRDAATEKFISNGKYNYMKYQQLKEKSQALPLTSKQEVPVLPDLNDFITILPGEVLTSTPLQYYK